jgi:hypothetical protein
MAAAERLPIAIRRNEQEGELMATEQKLRVKHQHKSDLIYFTKVALAMLFSLVTASSSATAAEGGLYRTAGGLAVYLGVIPAEIVKGHPSGHAEQTMHGGAPKGVHQYHVVAAVFDAASGARVSDAKVSAQVSGLGLSGPKKKLDPMEIANTISYGGFFDLPGRDLYTIGLTIERSGQPKPVSLEFKYDHRQ